MMKHIYLTGAAAVVALSLSTTAQALEALNFNGPALDGRAVTEPAQPMIGGPLQVRGLSMNGSALDGRAVTEPAQPMIGGALPLHIIQLNGPVLDGRNMRPAAEDGLLGARLEELIK